MERWQGVGKILVNLNHTVKKAQGFSLLEVLVALTVLAVAVIAMAKVQGLLISGVGYAEQQSIAVNLAEAKIENYRNYTSLDGAGNSYNNISSGSEAVVRENTTFTLNWIVVENGNPAYKQINVSVTWTGRDTLDHAINLISIIGRLDPVREGEIYQGQQIGGSIKPT